jgi:tight adherence protein C
MKWLNALPQLLLRKIRAKPRGALWLGSIQRKLELLRIAETPEQGAEAAEWFISKHTSGACVIWSGFVLLFVAIERQPLYCVVGFILAVCYVFLQIRTLDRLLERRKRTILLELPDLMNRIAMLVDAGESVQQAIVRCADKPGQSRKRSILQEELVHSMRQFRQGESFASAMEGLSKRCSVQEVTHFTTIVLLHYRRGGGDLVLTLRGAMRELWEKRKQVVRTIGEEASSKLIFPMMAIFLLIMIITAYPAIRLIG